MKKITVLILSSIIALSPLFNIGDFSYADTQPSWVYVTQQNTEPERTVVVGAVKAYLGARGYNNIFTYTAEKAVVQWSYNNWDDMARRKGYNGLSDLNNHIAYRYNSSGTLQFFLDDSSIEMMNQMYSAFLEYYNITENTNKKIYDGEWFEDDDGNSCYVFQVTQRSRWNFNNKDSINITYFGTPYVLNNGTYYINQFNTSNPVDTKTVSIDNTSHTMYIYFREQSGYGIYYNLQFNNSTYENTYSIGISKYNGSGALTSINNYGYVGIFKYNTDYYIGNFNKFTDGNNDIKYGYYCQRLVSGTSNAVNAAIQAAQAGMNAGIVAAGKSAAITTGKDGVNALKDYIEDNDSTDDDVVTPVDDPTPPEDIPSGGTPPGYNDTGGALTPDGNGGFNFNFKMPQLNINWNLNLNTNNLPFPFSIPSDFYKAFQAIDVEPEAPSFSKVIHLGFGNRWSYNWNFECDFSEIDGAETLANIHRKWFLFVYIVMLIIATRSVMHIY